LMSLPKDVNVAVTDIQGARWVDSQGVTWVTEPQGPHHLTAYFSGRIDGKGAGLYADRDAESSFFVKVFPQWKISQVGLH
jgi:hypothetical protein